MGSLPPEFMLDPLAYSNSTVEEKRAIVHSLLQSSQDVNAFLQAWTRREIIEIVCAETGKPRKYSGLAKNKLIDYLLKVIYRKGGSKHAELSDNKLCSSPNDDAQTSAEQGETVCPSSLLGVAKHCSNGLGSVADSDRHCMNSACRARLLSGDTFCRRCSCSICYKYDDNKDPSIWLVCNSDPPNEEKSCGLSCHLDCAFKDKRAGIMVGGTCPRLDGSFFCVVCKKVNDLLGCCRKQLLFAMDARRLDPLCYRILLGRKLLNGTEKFLEVSDIVETAAKKLENEIGSLDGLPSEMARVIVCRLSCGSEVQKLCASALQKLDSFMVQCKRPMADVSDKGTKPFAPFRVDFEDVSATSVTVTLKYSATAASGEAVCYTLWHRKANVQGYSVVPTGTLFGSDNRISITGLTPDTTYMLKVVASRDGHELENCEKKFSSLASNTKNRKILSSGGDHWVNNSAEIPSYGRKRDSGPNDRTHLMQSSKATSLDRVASNSISTLTVEGMNCCAASAPNLLVRSDSQKGSTNSLEEEQAINVLGLGNRNGLEPNVLLENSIGYEPNATEREIRFLVNQSDYALPSTPCKDEIRKDVVRSSGNWSAEFEKEPQVGSSSKKRKDQRCQMNNCIREGPIDKEVDKEFEHCVKVIRRMECQGHMEKSFREKLLTWFSLRATAQEKRIVNVFVETLIDDPPSLVEQLKDTFSEAISSKKRAAAPTGFCMRLWH